MLRFQGSLNSGPAYNLRCACVPRYDVRDMSCEGRHVERRVRKTGIHVGHTSARPDEENVQARMRARSRVQWFERKAVTRSSAHERAKQRRGRAGDLSGACTNTTHTNDVSTALER